jgi:hypothetical protein
MRPEKHARDINVTGDTMVIDESEDDDDISTMADDLSLHWPRVQDHIPRN